MPLRGVNKLTVFSAQSVTSGGGTATSSAISGIAAGQSMSLFVKVTGANGDVKVEILCSADATTYTKPESGGDVILSITDTNQHVMVIQIPLTIQFKLKLTNSGAGTVTVDGVVLSQ